MEMLLSKQELLDLGDQVKGLKIICCGGICWVTQRGDTRDYILKAGESMTSQNNSHLIVTATEECRLRLTSSALEDKLRQPLRDIISYFKKDRASSLITSLL